ncbi:proteoglycan 4 isoform X14 [Pseudophryne corroboree]|uniref:proteoglycan 4 isoform X14 n=1 Tax=Pseudophryne corroboree TaxID=495146 RepID=UPI003081CD93
MELKMCSSQLVLYFIISVSAVSAQGRESCDGRCGERYLRADLCHCDYNCMSYSECCPDYKSVCTTENSCKGRCHEGFIRGLACDCDPGCKDFGKCCPDYESACKKPTPRQPPSRSSEDPEPEARDNPPEPTKIPEDEMTKGSNQKPQSPNDEKDGKPKEPKIKEPNKKRPGDNDPEDPDNPPADPNQNHPVLKDDELRKPKTPNTKEEGEDPKDTEKSPKGPNQKPRSPNNEKPKDPKLKGPNQKPRSPNNEKDEKPKDPKLKEPNQRRPGDKDPEDPDTPPEGLNQKPRSPSNEKDGKPKDPKNKEPTPEGSRASPGDKTNNPQKTKTPTVKEEEDKEANEDTDDNTSSSSNLKNTKKRSPANTNKNPKKKIKPVGNTDEDPFGDPSPDKGKKKRITIVPKKKKKRVIYIDEDDDDEPSKPGKGKKPKKKPSNKNIVKKKKVNSEEERQETVESEFSSSSQSSTSHSRSKKSKRRMTGKNKKNLKKIPEEPEQPLKPPKRKKDKKFPPTPEPTFISEGSGDEGSGMPTTMAATTLITQSPTTESQTTVGTKKTEATVIPSTKPQTRSTDVTSYKTTPSTPNLLTTGETHEKTSTTISPNTQTLSSQKATPSTPSTVSTEEQPAKTSTTMSPHTQALTSYKATSISNIVSTGQSVKTSTTMSTHTPQERTTGQSMMTNTPVQQMSTLKTPKDQSTTDSSDIIATTISEILQETTKSMLLNSTPVDPTKQTPLEDNNKYTTSKPTSSAEYSTTTKSAQTTTTDNNMVFSTTATPGKVLDKDITVATETTMKHSVHTVSTKKPEEELELSSRAKSTVRPEQRPTLTKRTIYDATTKPVNTKTPTPSMYSTKTTNPTRVPTARKMNDEEMGNNINITKLENPFHVCDLLKDEGIKLRISDHDLQLITDMCMEMQQQQPPVSTPAPETRKPTVNYGNIPPRYTYAASNFNQQPETRIIEIVEEIYRRMNNSPVINITIVPGQNIYKPTVWLLLLNKIKSSYDPEKNLCIGKPADGMTTLQNGSMVVFRGNYFWTLNQGGVTESPRKISEVWGIPSPIDTVFTRCNCGAKTFFFKGPRYWRFTNDIMDQGYPKEITKGFGGLSGKVTAVLPVAGLNTRPESVYFFKTGGNVQKYTFRQEQSKKCIKKKRPVVQYPIYSQRVQTVKYRFPRNTVRHRIVIHRRISKVQHQQPLGILHEETTVRSTWRGVPNNIISAVSLANPEKQDGFDYFVFNKDKYYNINMSSKVAVKPPPESEQKTSKDWYKCKE